MPTFEIPDGPTTVDLPRPSDPQSTAPAEAGAVYNVTNKSSESCGGILTVNAFPPTKKEWFTIDGDPERTFGSGETQTASVKIRIPADVAPGDYKFQLLAAAANDTDNDVAKGPVSTAKLTRLAVGKKSMWWLWILLGIIALIAIGAGLYFLLRSDKPDAPVEAATPATGCRPGYVPREAAAADQVCVTPDSRDRVRVENRLADLRRQPGGGAYGPNTCKMGFVWREAYSGDFVCVEPEIRTLVRQENAEAAAHHL